jgi:hypothetical protein
MTAGIRRGYSSSIVDSSESANWIEWHETRSGEITPSLLKKDGYKSCDGLSEEYSPGARVDWPRRIEPALAVEHLFKSSPGKPLSIPQQFAGNLPCRDLAD